MDASEAFGHPMPASELPAREAFGTRLAVRGGVAWLALCGELDVFAAPTLRAAITSEEVAAADALVLDLRSVTFMDSSGLSVVLSAHERERGKGGDPLRIVIRGSEPVESLFRTIDAADYLHLIDGPEALERAGS